MNSPAADLHTHSHYSDGRRSPADLVEEAARLGLEHLAITDHDNLRGAREAQPLAEQAGIDLITGIELTTCWQHDSIFQPVDLLAYAMDWDTPAFVKLVDAALADIARRMAACCMLISDAGHPVTLDDLYAHNPRFAGVPQLFATLSTDQGLTVEPEVLALFDAVWPRVPPPALRIEQAIDAVHVAGGVAVLAHPVRVGLDGGLIQPETLTPLVESGLDGVEVYHPSAGIPAREHYRALAKRSNLLITGGSDEHAVGGSFDRLGRQPVTSEMVAALKARAASWQSRMDRDREHSELT